MAEAAVATPRGARSGSITTLLAAPEMAGPVTAADVARYLLALHGDYAGGRAGQWRVRWPGEGRRRPVEQWVVGCEGVLARETTTPPDVASAELAGPMRRMTTRTCLLLLGLLDPPVGRAMLESGLTGALLDEYEPVRGQGQQPLATVLGPAAVQRAGAVPALATAYGLAEPDRWDVAGPHVSSSAPDPAFDAVAVGWAASGEPVVGFADGTVRARGAESGVAVPVTQGPWQVGIGADGPWAVPVGEERRHDVKAKFVVTRPGRPVSRSVLGRARAVIGGIGPGPRPSLDVTVGGESWDVPLQGTTPPIACAVSDDGRVAIAAYQDGELVWVRRAGDVAGSAASTVSPVRVGGRVVAVGTDSRGERAAVLGDDAVSVVTGGTGGVKDSGSPLELAVLLRIRRAGEDQLAAALSPDGDRLAVLTVGSDRQSVEIHDLRLQPNPLRAEFDNDLPAFDGDRPPPDYAGVGPDVDALAMLLASTSLRPPLCLGLFGDWGSGKTWFMARLRSRVTTMSRQARQSGEPQRDVEYWKRVVTVDFNAWTFAEANLWASLMETILARLRDQEAAAGDPAAVGQRLLKDSLARARREETAAVDRRRATEPELKKARIRVVAVLTFAVAFVALAVAEVVFDAGLLAWVTGLGALVGAAGVYLQQWQSSRALAQGALGAAADVTRPISTWRALEAEQHERAEAAAKASAHVRDLQAAAANPERLVGTYLEERLEAEDYRQHLGLLGLVREDLRTLSNAVRAANDAALRADVQEATLQAEPAPEGPSVRHRRWRARRRSRGEPTEAAAARDGKSTPVVNRIVLFIDDLDRCPPSRVVEVLEAVHLLLAYELFVVVLAVDTRWLQQSLRTHYRGLLGGRARGAATAMDYIEKIVQMPFQLRPLTPDQVGRMINGLSSGGAAGGGAVPTRKAPAGEGSSGTRREPAGADGAGAPVPGRRQEPGATSLPASGTERGPAPAAPSGARPGEPLEEEASQADLRPEGLVIADHEAEYLVELSALVGQTPRTVKRFVNTYRVLKARMPDPSGFAADSGPTSDYRVAGLLLAVVVGLEDIAPEVFAGLRALSPDDSLGGALGGLDVTDPARAEQRDRLVAWLDDEHVADTPCAPYQEIAPVVARFSFTPLPG